MLDTAKAHAATATEKLPVATRVRAFTDRLPRPSAEPWTPRARRPRRTGVIRARYPGLIDAGSPNGADRRRQ
ncbi:MAG TPA: hypothetical protein VK306_09630 [Acidimicrobiales bacterium]|nr:hypothetical protein [Acidimicrobiales bacterium]